MAASYPGAAKTFTPLVDAVDYPQATQVNAIYDEVAALEAALVTTGLAHDLKFVDATYDIGKSGATRPRDGFFSRNLTVGGALTVTGGQVAFPATQAASADANTLDDYEEGTWTPVLNSFTVAGGTTLTGTYTKIGNRVFFECEISAATSLAATAGTSFITGLPFNPGKATTCTATNKSSAVGLVAGTVYTGATGIFPPTFSVGAAVVIVVAGSYQV